MTRGWVSVCVNLPKLVEFAKLRLLTVDAATSKRTLLKTLKVSQRSSTSWDSVTFQDLPQPGVDLEKARSAQFVPLTEFARKREAEGIYCITEIAEHVGITLRVPESSGMNRSSLDGRGSQLPIGTPEA
jgi:hypothetical protein